MRNKRENILQIQHIFTIYRREDELREGRTQDEIIFLVFAVPLVPGFVMYLIEKIV